LRPNPVRLGCDPTSSLVRTSVKFHSPRSSRSWLVPLGAAIAVTVLGWWSVAEWLLEPPVVLSEVVAISEPAREPSPPVEELETVPEAVEEETVREATSSRPQLERPEPLAHESPVVVAMVAEPEAVAETVLELAPAPSPSAPPPTQAPELPAVMQAESNELASDFAEFRAEFDNTVEEQTIAEDTIAEGEVGPSEHQGARPIEHVRGTTDVVGEMPETEQRLVAPDTSELAEVGSEPNEAGEGSERVQAREGTPSGQQSNASPYAQRPAVEEHVATPQPSDEERAAAAEEDGETPELVEGEGQPMPETGGDPLPETSVAQAVATMRPNFAAMQASPGPLGEVGGVGAEGYTSVFGSSDDAERQRLARGAREASISGDSEGRWERTRGALENYDVAVTAGTETRLNTRSDVTASYIHALHNRIHEPWRSYLARLDREFGAANGVVDSHRFGSGRSEALSSRGLSDPNLRVVVEIVIDSTGHVVDVNIARGSGALMFDAEAVDMVFRTGPHRPPPESLLSFDGNTYVRWAFHRDDRACGSFNASIRWLAAPSDTRGG
jgi:TonB family protein